MATPTLSSATISTNVLTITGTNFGTKSPAAPFFYQPFLTTSTGDDYAAAGFDGLGGNSQTLADNQVTQTTGFGIGAGSWKTVHGVGGETFSHFFKLTTDTDRFFCSFQRAMEVTSADAPTAELGQIKDLRAGPDGGFTGPTEGSDQYAYHYSQYAASSYIDMHDLNSTAAGDPVGQWFADGNATPNDVFPDFVPALPIANGDWYLKEYYYQMNTVTGGTPDANGKMRNRTNQYEYFPDVDTLSPRHDAAQFFQYIQFNPGYANGFSARSFNIYHSHIFLDLTWAHCFAGNASTEAACTSRYPLPGITWSDTGGTFDDADTIPSGHNWAFMVNANGEVNSTGYLITGGAPSTFTAVWANANQ